MTTHPVAFVGAGFHAQTNLLPSAAFAGIDVVALASRSTDRSRVALSRSGLNGSPYDSLDTLLQETPEVDRVIVCAQPADQPRLIRQLLESGKHVLSEKPLGLSEREAQMLATLANEKGLVLRAAFMKRFAPAVVEAKRLLGSAEIGEALSFGVEFAADASGFAPTPEQFLKLAAIHHLDLVRHLFGEPARVTTDMHRSADSYSILVTVRMRSGTVGTVRLTNSPACSSEVDRVRIMTPAGEIDIEDTRTLTLRRGVRDADWQRPGELVSRFEPPISTMSGGGQDLVLRGFVGELASFAGEHLAGGDASADSTVRTMAFVDAGVAALGPESGNPMRLTFGAPGETRDAINAAITSGKKTSSSNLKLAYDAGNEPVPHAGEERLLLDSEEQPIARIRFRRVSERLLLDVDAELAGLEGASVDEWRTSHDRYWRSLEREICVFLGVEHWDPADTDVVVTTEFSVEPLHASDRVPAG